MARKPTLSPSKLSCYLACPHKYYWTYVSPRGQWFLRAHSYFAFGQSLHRALETFHKTGSQGIPVRDALAAALEDNWIEAGYASSTEMQAAFGDAKTILDNIAEEMEGQSLAPGEDATVLFIEKHLRKPMGEWDLIGRADRIDEITTGGPTLVDIVDYKSGRSNVSSQEVGTDIAMSCYAAMVRDLFPDARMRATIHSLRTSQKASYEFSHSELDEIEFSVKELGDAIQNHHWEEFRPSRKALCATCDFVSLCRQDPDFAADEAGNSC